MKKTLALILILGSTLFCQGQDFVYFNEAIAEARKLNDLEESILRLQELADRAKNAELLDTLALIYHTIGVTSYKADVDRAIEATKEAIRIRTELKDTLGLSRSCFNVSRFYMLYKDRQSAIPYFEQIVALGPTPSNKNYYNSLVYLTQLERERGDYFKAIRFSELGITDLNAKKELQAEEQVLKAQFSYTLASVYNEIKGVENLQKSLKYITLAINILSAQGRGL